MEEESRIPWYLSHSKNSHAGAEIWIVLLKVLREQKEQSKNWTHSLGCKRRTEGWCELTSGACVTYNTVYELCLAQNMPLHFWMMGSTSFGTSVTGGTPWLKESLQLRHEFVLVVVNLQKWHTKTPVFIFLLLLLSLFVLSSDHTPRNTSTLGFVWNVGHLGIPLLHLSVSIVYECQPYARNITVLNSPFRWVVKGKAAFFLPILRSPQMPHTAPAGKREWIMNICGMRIYPLD